MVCRLIFQPILILILCAAARQTIIMSRTFLAGFVSFFHINFILMSSLRNKLDDCKNRYRMPIKPVETDFFGVSGLRILVHDEDRFELYQVLFSQCSFGTDTKVTNLRIL